jgi:hypothetical protein
VSNEESTDWFISRLETTENWSMKAGRKLLFKKTKREKHRN